MPVPKPRPRREIKEDWLVTYADAITLLMAFFVMLLTFAEFDLSSFEEAAAAIKKEVGGGDLATTTTELQIAIQDVVYEMDADRVVAVTKDKRGLVIELASNAFYEPGSADVRADAEPVLAKVAQMINAPRYLLYQIEVEGHTDDSPIATDAFPSNWELSTARATRIVRFFADAGLHPVRMKAAGYGETRPKAPNYDQDGTVIEANREINRRINIRVTPMTQDQRETFNELRDWVTATPASSSISAPSPEPAPAQ